MLLRLTADEAQPDVSAMYLWEQPKACHNPSHAPMQASHRPCKPLDLPVDFPICLVDSEPAFDVGLSCLIGWALCKHSPV